MLFLKDLDYLIYSSHKTATQSLNKIFNINNINSRHCHYIQHLTKNANVEIKTYSEMKQKFIIDLQKYKESYNKKINVVSIVRNPKDRLPSSFFQTYHTDEVCFLKKEEEETTIMKNSTQYLIEFFIKKIENKRLKGGIESLDEISNIFQEDIILNFQNNLSHYYYENELIKLFVLDFNKLTSMYDLDYINQCLGLQLKKSTSSNLSVEKVYFNKYKEFKEKLIDITCIIEKQYNSFYFKAFDDKKLGNSYV